MVLIWEDGRSRWECISNYVERTIPKEAKFTWDPDPDVKRWYTYDLNKAVKLSAYADPITRQRLEREVKLREELREASHATDADVDLPRPEGLDYLPFQRAGILVGTKINNVLIADEQGLGKTIQFLGIVNADPSVKQAVVVCPASLKFNWRDEAQKWFVRPFKTHVVSGSDWPTLDFNESNLIIINYDILDRHYDNLRQRTWDILGCDEVHFIKGGNTLRALNVIGGKKYGKDENGNKKLIKEYTQIPARRRVFMTGTPIPNRPKELWPIVHSLWPETFRSWWHYAHRYCNATNNGWGWNFNGASNLGELQTLLREHGMIRRLKKDVLTELPPKIWRVVEIPANGATRLVEQEREQYEKHRALQEELRVQVELAKASPDPEVFKDAVERLQKGVTASFDAMAKIRHELAIAKIPYIQEHLSVAFDDPNHKVVCFGHHRDFIEALHDKFKKKSVIYYGGMSDKKKDEAKKRFTSDPTCQGFIGSIMAAGVGLTLFSKQSHCSHAVFGEIDWVPANMAQAEDRLHRIGQEGSMIELETGEQVRGVLIEIFVFEGTLDCTIAKRVVEKMNVIAQALDIDPEQKGVVMEDLKEPITPEKETAASQGTSRRKIHEEARTITLKQIQAIGLALQRLAEFDDDSAMKRNAIGFNKMDTRIGKELAARSVSRRLTPGEAALGRKLVQRYQGQLPVEMVVACGITPKGEKDKKRETA